MLKSKSIQSIFLIAVKLERVPFQALIMRPVWQSKTLAISFVDLPKVTPLWHRLMKLTV